MENQDFPKFVTYNNETRAINMRPNTTEYQGRTYYFSVVLKEKKSDYMMNIYYMTIKMSGDPVEPEEYVAPNKTQVSMSITKLNYSSYGQITFTMGVQQAVFEDMTLFRQVFDVSVNNTLKEREEIRDIVFEVVDNKTYNFQVKFTNPYLYGLLNKRNDLLIFQCLNETFLLENATNQTLSPNYTTKRIDMQFDFRGKHYFYSKSSFLQMKR